MFALGLSEIVILPLFYAVTLMTSTAIANRLLVSRSNGEQASPTDDLAGESADFVPSRNTANDIYEVSEAGPYTSPATYGDANTPVNTTASYVPSPSFWKSWGIGFLMSLSLPFLVGGISLIGRLVLTGANPPPTSVFRLVALLAIVGAFGISTLALSRLLPAPLQRASLISLGIFLQLGTLFLMLLLFVS